MRFARLGERGRGLEHAPKRVEDYAHFLTAASRRYPRVRHWMIWGETESRCGLPASSRWPADWPAALRDAARRGVRRAEEAQLAQQGHRGDDLHQRRGEAGGLRALDAAAVGPYASLGLLRPQPSSPSGSRASASPRWRRARATCATSTPSSASCVELSGAIRGFGAADQGCGYPSSRVSSDRPNRAFGFAVSRAEQARGCGPRIASLIARATSNRSAGSVSTTSP